MLQAAERHQSKLSALALCKAAKYLQVQQVERHLLLALLQRRYVHVRLLMIAMQ